MPTMAVVPIFPASARPGPMPNSTKPITRLCDQIVSQRHAAHRRERREQRAADRALNATTIAAT